MQTLQFCNADSNMVQRRKLTYDTSQQIKGSSGKQMPLEYGSAGAPCTAALVSRRRGHRLSGWPKACLNNSTQATGGNSPCSMAVWRPCLLIILAAVSVCGMPTSSDGVPTPQPPPVLTYGILATCHTLRDSRHCHAAQSRNNNAVSACTTQLHNIQGNSLYQCAVQYPLACWFVRR